MGWTVACALVAFSTCGYAYETPPARNAHLRKEASERFLSVQHVSDTVVACKKGSNISSVCCTKLQEWEQHIVALRTEAVANPGLDTDWFYALDMLDANINWPAGFYQHTLFALTTNSTVYNLGSFDMCTELPQHISSYYTMESNVYNKTLYNMTTDKSDAYLFNYVHGLCVPAQCSSSDAKAIKSVSTSVGTLFGILDLEAIVTTATEAPRHLEVDAWGIVAYALMAVLTVTAFVCSVVDWYVASQRKRRFRGRERDTHIQLLSTQTEFKTDVGVELRTPPQEKAMWYKIIQCFSWYHNFPKLMSMERSPNAIPVLDGVRALSMCYVIIGHTYFWVILNPIANNYSASHLIDSFWFAVIEQATMSVDSFFVLSGFLVCYGTLKLLDKTKGKFPWVAYYVYRFVRLTPAYFLVLVIYMGVERMIGNGPLWNKHVQTTTDGCHQYFWTNILYINNFYPASGAETSGCMGWTWYLANDMQFHIISAFILIPLWRSRKLGWAIVIVIIIASVVATALINDNYHYLSGSIGKDESHINDGQSFNRIYIKPYTRVPAYVIGILLADLWRHSPQKEKPMSWKLGCPLMFISLVGIYLVLIAPWLIGQANGISVQIHLTDFYQPLSRVVWSLCLSIIIYVCMRGGGGMINWILSWPFFQPMGRVTFCAYLVHPIICDIIYASQREAYTVQDQFKFVHTYFGILSIAYGVAIVLTLLIESPLINLTKLVFK